MRRFAAAAPLFLLMACEQAAEAPAGEPITCALGGVDAFTADCRAERVTIDGRPGFVVHHPDGGFRRFLIATDGQSVDAADGADVARSARKDGRYEVIVSNDRYFIPVVGDAAPR